MNQIKFFANLSSPLSLESQELSHYFQNHVYVEIIIIIYIISFLIVWYNLFKKGGQKGWAIFIPFYNIYIIGKIAKRINIAFLLIFLDLLILFSNYFVFLAPFGFILELYLIYLFSKRYNINYLLILVCKFLPMFALFFLDNIQLKKKTN